MLEDLRSGFRGLAKNPGVTAVAVLSLALGVGANTTIFTLINAVLLQPLPVRDPASLVAVNTVDSHNPGLLPCSYPNFRDLREQNQVFSSLLVHESVGVSLTGRGDPQLLIGQLVSGDYFATLGINPIVGRGFLPEEDSAPSAAPVVVLSYALWSRLYGADPNVTGQTIGLNGRAYRIVGVAPAGFQGLNELYAADLWVPFMMYPQVYPNVSWVEQRRALIFSVVGRLKPGVRIAQAEGAMQSIAQELARQYPKDNTGRGVRLSPVSDIALSPKTRNLVTNAGGLLMVISALVLMIACANVANLLLARALGRSKEITVKLALGASRGRLVRQLLTESVLLSVLGCAAGLGIAFLARNVMWALRPPAFKHTFVHLDLDMRVMLYSVAVSLLTGILFGLSPALRATRTNLATDLKERTTQAPQVGGRWNPRSAMVIGQVAFSLITLVGAGLFVRSILNAGRINPGFDASQVGFVTFNVADQGYNEARGRDYQRRALEAAATVPGVISAGLSRDQAFHVSGARAVLLEGQDNTVSGKGRITLTSVIGPAYLKTVGIPLLRGRDFSELDNSADPHVAIVNEVAAAHFWPGQEAIGKRLFFLGDKNPAEVVGISRNANYQTIGEPPQALIYLSLTQYYFPTAVVYVRTAGDPELVSTAVRHAMQPLDRNLLLQSESIETTIRDSLWAQRLSASLLTIFGGLALLLSTIGIYGVVSFSVRQRVREIGVRMALGATVTSVQMMIVREGIRLVAIGVAIGLVIALAAAKTIESMLFVIQARDAVTFILVPSFMSLIAVLACWVPAIRATRVDPSIALRDE